MKKLRNIIGATVSVAAIVGYPILATIELLKAKNKKAGKKS